MKAKIMRLRSKADQRNGNTHEVFAPEGYRFIDGPHSVICTSLQEAQDVSNPLYFVKCGCSECNPINLDDPENCDWLSQLREKNL